MPLESQDAIPWGVAVRKGEPEWAAYMTKVVEDWAKTGCIEKLETQYHISHSKYAEAAREGTARRAAASRTSPAPWDADGFRRLVQQL